jgi:predicted nucleotidyltransferase
VRAPVEMLERVALRLGDLKSQVAFVGGAITGLLITDAGAPPPRPTDDIDLIVEVGVMADYYQLAERLRTLGFAEDTSEEAPVCRWLVEGIKVDVMPTSGVPLGFSNRWYSDAIESAEEHEISPGTLVRVVSAPYFIATKIEAYRGRGNGDLASSHDIEDVVAVVDGRAELADECAGSPHGLRAYVAKEMATLLASEGFAEAIAGHLRGDAASQGRVPLVLTRLRALAAVQQP